MSPNAWSSQATRPGHCGRCEIALRRPGMPNSVASLGEAFGQVDADFVADTFADGLS